MPTNSNPNYFNGKDISDFSFFRIPRALVKDKRFRDVSTDSKLLYSLMLDRMGLSIQNGWQDTKGRTFIYFTLEEIQATLSCGHNKAVRLLAELEKYNLIERLKQGQGKPAKIYVKEIDSSDTEKERAEVSPEPADSKKSEKPTHRLPVSKHLDFPKGEGNYTKKNYTDFSYINQSINHNQPQPTSPVYENQVHITDILRQDSYTYGVAVTASMSFGSTQMTACKGKSP